MDIKAYVGSWITKDEYKQITGQDYDSEAQPA
ncbi:XkdX family protein [Limosilactobacillus pontis]|uniref:XkdX family protein n=1 Tax=Limosilactobacillus pontis TaxID=35787 RepID=A0ABU7SV11_9LACO